MGKGLTLGSVQELPARFLGNWKVQTGVFRSIQIAVARLFSGTLAAPCEKVQSMNWS